MQRHILSGMFVEKAWEIAMEEEKKVFCIESCVSVKVLKTTYIQAIKE